MIVADFDPTNRFTSRVSDYVRYRPRYPQAIMETLRAETGLRPEHVIADIGSGTGFSAEMFLQNGNTVNGIEPNAAMRAAGELVLAGYPRFSSVAGAAEATTLADASVDYVTAGQALHWFDLPRARAEFARILRRPGWVALFWNTHQADLSPFLQEYEALFHHTGHDYTNIAHGGLRNYELATLFDKQRFIYCTFPFVQRLTLEGLIGRAFSASYAPPADSPEATPFRSALESLFARFGENGTIQYDYVTELYFGPVAAAPPAHAPAEHPLPETSL